MKYSKKGVDVTRNESNLDFTNECKSNARNLNDNCDSFQIFGHQRINNDDKQLRGIKPSSFEDRGRIKQEVFFRTFAGKCYHRGNCQSINGNKSKSEISPAEATKNKLRPCLVCDPPLF